MAQPNNRIALEYPSEVRWLLFAIGLTAILSLIYASLYLAGGPLQLPTTSEINDVAASHDGSLVAAAGQDGVIRIWEADNNWAMRTLSCGKSPVLNVDFYPAGSRLLSTSQDGMLVLWDAANGQLERAFDTGSSVRAGSLSTDGTVLATLDHDGIVHVLDATDGQVLASIRQTGPQARAIALSADGSRVAIGVGPSIQIRSARGGELLQELEGYWENPERQTEWQGHQGDVAALAFSPDGKMLVSGGADTLLVVWDLETGTVFQSSEGHWDDVIRLAFSVDGSRFLSGCQDSKARLWLSGGKYLASFEGHLGAVKGVAFIRDTNQVVTGGGDGTLRLWDVVTNSVLRIVWAKIGLMPSWGPVLGVWFLLSGLVGLAALWGLRGRRSWGHLLGLGLFLIGPLIVVGVPLLEVLTSYPLSWALKLQVAWPLTVMALWYAALMVLLTMQPVAIHYEAPTSVPLADQLMARRRTLRLRFGLYAAAVWVVLLVVLYSVLRRFNLDISFMQHYLPFIITGAGMTLYISVASIALAVVLALCGALGRLSSNYIANGVSGFYVSLIRGTPLLVQIFIWYLGLPRLGIVLQPELAGILALGVNYGAYMTEIFRAGIQAIGKGQHEAAHALGMSGAQTFRRIVMPQAFRIVIPPIGNEFIAMMKDSALVSVMSIWELTYRAQKLGRQYFRAMETFLIAAAFYWVLTVVFQFLQGKLEDYMARSERR